MTGPYDALILIAAALVTGVGLTFDRNADRVQPAQKNSSSSRSRTRGRDAGSAAEGRGRGAGSADAEAPVAPWPGEPEAEIEAEPTRPAIENPIVEPQAKPALPPEVGLASATPGRSCAGSRRLLRRPRLLYGFQFLRQRGWGLGLRRTRENFLGRLRAAIAGRAKVDEIYEGLEEALIAADVGVEASMKLVDAVKRASKATPAGHDSRRAQSRDHGDARAGRACARRSGRGTVGGDAGRRKRRGQDHHCRQARERG